MLAGALPLGSGLTGRSICGSSSSGSASTAMTWPTGTTLFSAA